MDVNRQLYNLLVASVHETTISDWLGIVSNSTLPMMLLLPQENNTKIAIRERYLLSYHVIPMKLPFISLLQFPQNSPIPTVMPSTFIYLTNKSPSNLTLSNVLITKPNLLITPSLVVHGIKHLMDYSKIPSITCFKNDL
jgi:hypothetical protein